MMVYAEALRDRALAVRLVLVILRNPLMLMSPQREQALELARRWEISAEELIQAARGAAQTT